jgi:hypothetical protein
MLPMEEGRYRARAVSWQLGEAGTGTPQVGIEFQVEDGDHKDARISGYFALTDLAAEYTLEKLRNCGWTGTNILDLDDPVASASMKANVVELVCKPEDVKDKDGKPVVSEETGEVRRRLRIQFVNRGGGLAMKSALGEDKKKLLAAQMKAKLAVLDAKERRNGGSAPAPTNGPRSPEPPPVTDDIPF